MLSHFKGACYNCVEVSALLPSPSVGPLMRESANLGRRWYCVSVVKSITVSPVLSMNMAIRVNREMNTLVMGVLNMKKVHILVGRMYHFAVNTVWMNIGN